MPKISLIATVINPETSFKKQRDMDCNEALALLKAYGWGFMSWGPSAFTNCKNKALRFRVNGHHHKGFVYISVNGADLYDYVLTDFNNVVVGEDTDIYFDELFERLDKAIEWIPEYKH
jgi:hypothetical protein